MVAQSIAECLGQRGFEIVDVLATLSEYVGNAARTRPDVLVSDSAPVDAGSTLAADVSAEMRAAVASGCSVVILSSFDAPYLVGLAEAAGAAAFVSKSEDVASLVSAIIVAAGGGTRFPSSTQTHLPPSRRELEIMHLVTRGRSSAEIGCLLGISVRTIDAHMSRLFARFGVASRTQLIVLAIERGWVSTPLPTAPRASSALPSDQRHRTLPFIDLSRAPTAVRRVPRRVPGVGHPRPSPPPRSSAPPSRRTRWHPRSAGQPRLPG